MTDHIGPYELRSKLGSGASSTVWRAFDTRLEREVALKVADSSALGDSGVEVEEFRQRIVQEARAIAQLKHENIVAVHSVDVIDGSPVIDMELIRGETLQSRLSKGAISPRAALDMTMQLLEGVAYAHSKGIIHRDIKPENIFLTVDAKGVGLIKLTDFGIASRLDDVSGASLNMGTLLYMAPEQIAGDTGNESSDLFSVAVVLYQMLMGEHPFAAGEAETISSISYKITNEAPSEVPDDVVKSLPVDPRMALRMALSKNPVERPASALFFKNMLLGLAGGSVSHAPSDMPAVVHSKTGVVGSLNPVTQNPVSAAQYVGPQTGPLAKPKSNSQWIPYAIVGGIGAVAILIIFMTAGSPIVPSGTSAPSNAPAAVKKDNDGANQEDTTAMMSEADAIDFLSKMFDKIDRYGAEDIGIISEYITTSYNPAYGADMSLSHKRKCEKIRNELVELRNELNEANVPSAYSSVVANQNKLIDYCITRITVMKDAVDYVRDYGDTDPDLLNGRAAKKQYDELVASGNSMP